MIIQHNIMAINSHRQLTINNSNLGKNLEKLSSGYRINRAADDAAGLAISEKMRAQITGLERASLNAQDGSSLIQTAEGALTEVHSMLNRMVELATQSANGTIQDDDRQKIESEVNALKEEIDRISKATNFNGINLLDGSLSTEGGSSSVSSIKLEGIEFDEVAASKGEFTGTGAAFANKTTGGTSSGDVYKMKIELDNGKYYEVEMTINDEGDLEAADGTTYTITGGAGAEEADKAKVMDAFIKEFGKIEELGKTYKFSPDGDHLKVTNRVAGGSEPKVTNISVDQAAGSYTNATAIDGSPGVDAFNQVDLSEFTAEEVFTVNGVKFAFTTDGTTAKDLDKDVHYVDLSSVGGGVAIDSQEAFDAMKDLINQKTGLGVEVTGTPADATDPLKLNFKVAEGSVTGKGGLTMQVGDTADDFNKITVSVDDMSSAGLNIDLISMATQEAAAAALDKVKAAIEQVSVNRGNLGALQNRLEHTINNLGVTTENMTAAESRIRDVDMAKEMMDFTKNNVLAQAAQAMLAQANQQPQMVLQLLR